MHEVKGMVAYAPSDILVAVAGTGDCNDFS